MNELVIETRGLKKKFGSFEAVRGIDLRVRKGEIYGFLGPNGAGKSTTIRMLLGLIKPTEGEAKVFGKSIKTNTMEILSKVGSTVESPSYYGNLTAYENLEITRRILEVNKKKIDEVLNIVNLSKWKNTKVKKFSMGMKQRLAIAQALLGNRELLILDEPTNGLDPSGIHEIRDLIISLPKMMGVTIMISSHILSEIELMATQVGIISKGNLLFQGTLDELRSKNKARICVKPSSIIDAGNSLIQKGLRVERMNEMIYIDKGVMSIEEINKYLVLNGYDVSYLSESQESLEDIFLEMTGGIAQ